MPTQFRDRSARVGDDFPVTKLLEPFCLVANNDVFAQRSSYSTLQEAFSMYNIALHGRPLWGGVLKARVGDVIKRVIDLARRKILGGFQQSNFTGDTLAELDNIFAISIACLGFRVVLDVHSHGFLAETLPSQNMRYITAISGDRDAVMTDSLSDPLLSYAASTLMHDVRSLRPAELLRHLRASLQHKLVSPGEIGETISSVVFTLARDHTVFRSSSSTLSPIMYPTFQLRDFLKSIQTGCIATLEAQGNTPQLERLLSATMSFSHFISIEYTPTRHDILEFFLRGAAIKCNQGQPGIDFIIPILLPPAPGQTTRVSEGNQSLGGITSHNDQQMNSKFTRLVAGKLEESNVIREPKDLLEKLSNQSVINSSWVSGRAGSELDVDNISFILIQVKNRIKPDRKDDSKITPIFSGIVFEGEIEPPYLAIRHELRVEYSGDDATQHEAMAQLGSKHGLIIYRLKDETCPCFGYRMTPEDQPLSHVIDSVLTTSIHAVQMWSQMQDRLALAHGAFWRKLKSRESSDRGIASRKQVITTRKSS
jgi:hypothetical protein